MMEKNRYFDFLILKLYSHICIHPAYNPDNVKTISCISYFGQFYSLLVAASE